MHVACQEVVAFAGLSTGDMVTRLCDTVAKTKVDEYYEAMFPAANRQHDPESF